MDNSGRLPVLKIHLKDPPGRCLLGLDFLILRRQTSWGKGKLVAPLFLKTLGVLKVGDPWGRGEGRWVLSRPLKDNYT